MTFWAEVLITTTYVIIRSPLVSLDSNIPQSLWSGKDIFYRHLKVFGCLAYVHVAKDLRGKLDPKSQTCIFLDHDNEEFGYWLWDLAEKKEVKSWDIVFMEETTIVDWEIENNYPTTESSWVDAKPNWVEVGSIEIESEPIDWLNTRKNREPTEEQGEPTKQGIESNLAKEVKEELTVPNGGRRYPLRERRAAQKFPDEERVLLTNEGDLESFEEVKNDTHSGK